MAEKRIWHVKSLKYMGLEYQKHRSKKRQHLRRKMIKIFLK